MSRSTHLAVACFASWSVAACAHRFGPVGPELRLSTNPDVRWEAKGPHDLALIIENTGSASVAIQGPLLAHAHVVVFEPAGTTPVCRKDDEAAPESNQLEELAPRERRALVVRLTSCDLVPGEYRYEASYVIPAVSGKRPPVRLGPAYGRILVQSQAAAVDEPTSRSEVSPPEPGAPLRLYLPEKHYRPAVPPLGPSSLACIDRELARRGLNAWGDPAGTVYPEGPPTLASDVDRQKIVFERYPDIATLCRIPP